MAIFFTEKYNLSKVAERDRQSRYALISMDEAVSTVLKHASDCGTQAVNKGEDEEAIGDYRQNISLNVPSGVTFSDNLGIGLLCCLSLMLERLSLPYTSTS